MSGGEGGSLAGNERKSAKSALALGVLGPPWAFMLTRRSQFSIGILFFALGATWLGACDLNPQPLPPGLTSSGAADDGGALATVPTGSSSGGGGLADAGASQLPSDGGPNGSSSPDGGPPLAADGAATSASDAAADAPSDGSAEDGQADAGPDADTADAADASGDGG